ncbi:MAG: hypothetical protein GQ558_02580 [Thermoplasmata archaeon]|nr:hypothetical protein [Thermoplasmata archaeon]
MPRREELPKLLGVVLYKSPKLLLKVSWRYLKVKKQAQRAEKAFRQQLEDGGMDPEAAARLAEKYGSTASLRQMIKEAGVPGQVMNLFGKR